LDKLGEPIKADYLSCYLTHVTVDLNIHVLIFYAVDDRLVLRREEEK